MWKYFKQFLIIVFKEKIKIIYLFDYFTYIYKAWKIDKLIYKLGDYENKSLYNYK